MTRIHKNKTNIKKDVCKNIRSPLKKRSLGSGGPPSSRTRGGLVAERNCELSRSHPSRVHLAY